MARPYRLQAENTCYHIICRGNNRNTIFRNQRDYNKFLEYLISAKDKYNFYIYAYALMPNHYHLLLETTQPNISKLMHYVNSSYTTYFNIKHKAVGHLFQGRFKSIIISKDSYLLELSRYIHLNPVRARIVNNPENYKWSSFVEYIRTTENSIVDLKEMRNYFTMNSDEYCTYVYDAMNVNPTFLKNIYAGFILGNTAFIKDKLGELKDQVDLQDISYKEEIECEKRATLDSTIECYAEKCGLHTDTLCNTRKRVFLEKNSVIYAIKKSTDFSNREIGEKFKISYSAVSKIMNMVEKERLKNKKLNDLITSLVS